MTFCIALPLRDNQLTTYVGFVPFWDVRIVRKNPKNSNPEGISRLCKNSISIVKPQSIIMAAKEIRVYRNLAKKLINIEERGEMLRKLVECGVGLRQLEENRLNEASKLIWVGKF